jgi:trk system potassium uptake protein TrkH
VLGVGGLLLDPRALPGVASERLPARAFEAVRVSLPLWLALTVGAALLFLASGMGPLDALCAALACLSTGALLSPLAPGGLASAVAVGALLAGAIGVPLLYRAAAGSLVWSREPELRALVGVFAFATLLVAVDVRGGGGECGASPAAALETAAQHTAAMLATAGLHGERCGELPPLTRALLMVLLVVGGTAASASGGLRLGRLLALVHTAFAHFFRLVHPRGFQVVRVGGRALDSGETFGIAGFVGLWLAALLVGACLLALHGLDARGSLAAAAAALANSDAAWSGRTAGVATLAPSGKLVLAGLMLLGRLELYCVLVLLAPGLWRRSWR